MAKRTWRRAFKANFLAIYGYAHNRALTTELVKAAFEKTGVHPFNPDVVTKDVMAPSQETSCRGHLPLIQTTPVRLVSQLICRATEVLSSPARTESGLNQESLMTQPLPSTPSHAEQFLRHESAQTTVNRLATTSAAFLFTLSPVCSTSQVPMYMPQIVSPLQYKRYSKILNRPPATEAEHELQVALQESGQREEETKRQMIGLQAASVLQIQYCDRVRGQLAAQEEKAGRKKGTRLVGDGLPRMLTGDVFVAQVITHENAMEAEAREKEMRAKRRAERSEELAHWKREEIERKERNKATRANFEAQKLEWEAERDLAKLEKRRPQWNKPKMGIIEKPVPRPERVQPEVYDSEQEDDDGEDDG
jgi:hypothetical protein